MHKCSFFVRRFIHLIGSELRLQADHLIQWVPVFQAMGIILYFSLEYEPTAFWVITLLISGIVLVFIIDLSDKLIPLSIIVLGIVGFVCAYARTSVLDLKHFVVTDKTYVKDKVGTLREINYRPKHVQLLVCDVEVSKRKKTCIRLAVRTVIDPIIQVGDIIKFTGVIYPPKAPISHNGYDFARDAYFKGIGATGFTTSAVVLQEKGASIRFLDWIERSRIKTYERFAARLSRDTTEVLSALLIGKRQGIREEILKDVRRSGLAHLLAISGLHLSCVAGMVFIFFRHVFVCSEKLTLLYNIKKLCSGIAIGVSFYYLLLAGMPISACRAFIMVLLTFCGIIIDRRHNSMRSLSVAASVILLATPEAILSPSFQMSFAAVLSLVSFGNLSCSMVVANNILQYLVLTATVSLIASLATAPYVIYHFQEFSIAGVLANVIAVPTATFVVIPLGVLYLITCDTFFAPIIAFLLEWAVSFLLYIAHCTALTELFTSFRSIPSGAVLLVTLGLLTASLCTGCIRLFGGVIFTFLGTVSAITYKTPDIICDDTAVVVKGRDANLYFVMQNGSTRGFKYAQWARDNGQGRIKQQGEFLQDKMLVCEAGGCIYKDHVLITSDSSFLVAHCKNMNLIICNEQTAYPEECSDIKHIGLQDIRDHGVHYIWMNKSSVYVEKSITRRPWHKNARGLTDEDRRQVDTVAKVRYHPQSNKK